MAAPVESLIAEYPETPFFADLDRSELTRLQQLTELRHYKAGEVIVAEGTFDPFMYVIRRGRVRIDKRESDGKGSHTINVLGPGESLGEMKLAQSAPASATVLAVEPTDVIRIDLQRLRDETDDSGLRETLLNNIARIVSDRLRAVSTRTADAMEAELRLARLREWAGHFTVYLFAIMSGFAFFVAGTNELGKNRPSQALLSTFIILFAATPVALLLRRSPVPLRVYGLTLHRWGRVVWEATLFTLPILALMTAAKGAWVLSNSAHRGVSIIQPILDLKTGGDIALWGTKLVVYSLLSAVQEFFVRAGLQSNVRLFEGGQAGKTNWRSILIANLLFASAHAYLGVRFMLGAFVPGLFWGWLFDRQQSLVGVSVSHALIGSWGLFVIGLQVLVGGT